MHWGTTNCASRPLAKDAEQLDKLRSSPYWSTTRELFARAGAAYVQDKIENWAGALFTPRVRGR